VLVSFREKAVSSLAMLAVHPDPDVARPAAAAIGLLGPAGAPAVPSLVRALLHDNPFVPPHAANSLGMIGPAAIDAVPELRRIADDHLAGAHEAERAIQRIDVRSPPAVRGG